tara:strand:- start:426 stop:833 length:408 start_codon:yes stop_codon:yes gene_type:complete
MNPKFFNSAGGEFPPVKVGQIVMADHGLTIEDMADIDDEFGRCRSLDEQVAVLYDHPEILNKIFLGSVLARTDTYITLRDVAPSGEDQDFPFTKIMAIYAADRPPAGRASSLLAPEHVNKLIARLWKNVRWPGSE